MHSCWLSLREILELMLLVLSNSAVGFAIDIGELKLTTVDNHLNNLQMNPATDEYRSQYIEHQLYLFETIDYHLFIPDIFWFTSFSKVWVSINSMFWLEVCQFKIAESWRYSRNYVPLYFINYMFILEYTCCLLTVCLTPKDPKWCKIGYWWIIKAQ